MWLISRRRDWRSVSLTLVSAGGVERAEPHVRETAGLIQTLDLRSGDHVFLLDENEVRGSERPPAGL